MFNIYNQNKTKNYTKIKQYKNIITKYTIKVDLLINVLKYP